MRFDLVYISGITLGILAPIIRQKLLRFLERYRAAGGLVAFDSNFRPQLWESHKQALQSIDAFWRACDSALPSMDDERALFGAETTDETFQRFASYGVTSGALKRAGEGPQLLYHTQPDENFSSVARVVDTTAAGDSFNAGFLASLIAGHTEHHAAANGHAIASEVIQKKGAIVELPKKKWL